MYSVNHQSMFGLFLRIEIKIMRLQLLYLPFAAFETFISGFKGVEFNKLLVLPTMS